MGFTFDMTAYREGLAETAREYHDKMVDDQRQRARRIRDKMRDRAPKDPEHPDLPGSITVEEGRDALGNPYFDVGTSDEDAFYQEKGTRFQPPQPFGGPSVLEESQ